MIIRPEEPSNVDDLRSLTRAAFAPMRFSDGTEPEALEMLRRDGDLALSLVAIEGDEIVGHIAFSPAVVGPESEGWFGIEPVSVAPHRQRRGVGSALMKAGLGRLRAEDAKGCVLTAARPYYGRFGFVADGAVAYRDTPAAHVQWLAFNEDRPKGEVRFSAGLQE